MVVRQSSAVWEGNLKQGRGKVKLASGAYEGPYTFLSRFEQGAGTNPEELIAAAHAGCFSMKFAGDLSQKGYVPKSVKTTAAVTLDIVNGAATITGIRLATEVDLPGIDEKLFLEIAESSKANCPVSKALAATPITLEAKLVR
ncbi:MAG: peroxiredoxin [Candidatus Aminicenantes bacterium RBG_16_63_16]|nr:MAG: peroxiredoxin [Candidatus Aminicenantes bacterium RBG_16_63_16]